MNVIALLALCIAGWTDEDANRHLFPSRSNMVMHIDLQAVRQAGIFNEEIQRAFKAIVTENEQVKKLSQLLSFDPEKQIAGFTVCGVGEGREGNALMIVNGQFPSEELGKQLSAMVENGELTGMSINDLPVYFNHKARQAVYFAVVDGSTAIASTSKRILKDAVQGLTDLREPAAELKSRLDWGVDEDGKPPAMTIAGVFPEEAKQNMSRIPQMAGFAKQLVAYNIVFHFGEPNQFSARLTLTDANAAKAASLTFKLFMGLGITALRTQNERPDIVEMMEKVKIGDKDKDLTFEAEFPRSLLETFANNNRRDQSKFEQRRRERIEARKKSGGPGLRLEVNRKDADSKSKPERNDN